MSRSAVRELLPAPHFLVAMGASFLIAGLFYEVLHFRHLWAFLGLLAGLDLHPCRLVPSVREAMTWAYTWTRSAGSRRLRIPGRAVLDNITARLVAVVALGLGTILVARVGGAEDVGVLALLRVVPGLVGVLAACGLPGAMGYFLAGPHSTEARLWPTILARARRGHRDRHGGVAAARCR